MVELSTRQGKIAEIRDRMIKGPLKRFTDTVNWGSTYGVSDSKV